MRVCHDKVSDLGFSLRLISEPDAVLYILLMSSGDVHTYKQNWKNNEKINACINNDNLTYVSIISICHEQLNSINNETLQHDMFRYCYVEWEWGQK